MARHEPHIQNFKLDTGNETEHTAQRKLSGKTDMKTDDMTGNRRKLRT